jgi:hypothetical protein
VSSESEEMPKACDLRACSLQVLQEDEMQAMGAGGQFRTELDGARPVTKDEENGKEYAK